MTDFDPRRYPDPLTVEPLPPPNPSLIGPPRLNLQLIETAAPPSSFASFVLGLLVGDFLMALLVAVTR